MIPGAWARDRKQCESRPAVVQIEPTVAPQAFVDLRQRESTVGRSGELHRARDRPAPGRGQRGGEHRQRAGHQRRRDRHGAPARARDGGAVPRGRQAGGTCPRRRESGRRDDSRGPDRREAMDAGPAAQRRPARSGGVRRARRRRCAAVRRRWNAAFG